MLPCCAMHETGRARRACVLQESCAPALQHISLVTNVMRLVGGCVHARLARTLQSRHAAPSKSSCNAEAPGKLKIFGGLRV